MKGVSCLHEEICVMLKLFPVDWVFTVCVLAFGVRNSFDVKLKAIIQFHKQTSQMRQRMGDE